jgi:protein SCO1/2
MTRRHWLIAGIALSACWPVCLALADSELPQALREVRFDQRLDEQVPLDIPLVDEAGHPVKLGDYFSDKPVILVLAYYRCPMLCTMVLNGLVKGLLDVPFRPEQDFRIVTVSFDASETPQQATAKKKTYVDRFGREGAAAGWHFLTGPQQSIDRLTEAVGFHYSYDAASDQFAHASGIMILTPQGRISRYLYDVQYPGRDLRMALVEASQGKIGSPVDQVLLYCFHYDPSQGKYGPAVMALVRAGGVLTLVCLGLFIAWVRRRGRMVRSRTELAGLTLAGSSGAVSMLQGVFSDSSTAAEPREQQP